MKVFDLNGKEYTWALSKYQTNLHRSCSSLHVEARDLIKKVYPNIIVLEEVPIKIYSSKTLFLDFYLPMYKKAIEVHGSQHFTFNTQFHSTKFDFKRQQLNDMLKEEWCTINNITMVVLPHYRI